MNSVMLRTARLGAKSAAGVRQYRATTSNLRVYDSILDTIGSTPIVKLNKISPEGVTMYAKLEYFNPLSSVKDRLALAAVEDAEAKGLLKPGQTIVEATSGNTGISLSMVCAAKGYPLVITMAESFSIERRKIMRMLGAKVILTPAAQKGTGMVKKAAELAEKHGWFQTKQFENEANPAYHANTTGPEILSDFAGKRLDYWVTGYGTGGTFQGVGKMIKAARPNDTKVILSEPENAALVSSGIKTERNPDGSHVGTHPSFNPHPIQGWTPDFIPSITEKGMELGLCDEIVQITGPESMAMSHRLAREEGIFCGVSGGGTVATALKVAQKAPKGSVIVAMVADTAERYMSTPLFGSIEADMNDEEKEISKSTPTAVL